MTDVVLFWCTSIILLFFCYRDIKYQQLENRLLLCLLAALIGYRMPHMNFHADLFLALLFMIPFSYLLWKKGSIGGADSKLLMILTLALPFSGIPNMFAVMLYFLCIFMVLGILYAFIWTRVVKKVKYIPFLPVITLSYGAIYALHIV